MKHINTGRPVWIWEHSLLCLHCRNHINCKLDRWRKGVTAEGLQSMQSASIWIHMSSLGSSCHPQLSEEVQWGRNPLGVWVCSCNAAGSTPGYVKASRSALLLASNLQSGESTMKIQGFVGIFSDAKLLPRAMMMLCASCCPPQHQRRSGRGCSVLFLSKSSILLILILTTICFQTNFKIKIKIVNSNNIYRL